MKDWNRKITVGLTTMAALLIAVTLSACFGDSGNPTQPLSQQLSAANRPQYVKALTTEQLLAQGLLWTHPMPPGVLSATKVIGRNGGNLDLGPAGLQLRVPRGAVTADTRFTVTALPGNVVAYDFEPHGTTFAVPLTFVQQLGGTNADHIKLPKGYVPNFDGAYYVSPSQIDQTTGVAQVQELIPADSGVTFSGNSLSFPIWHFSGYMISTGRAPR
jgi:hypothetical protein